MTVERRIVVGLGDILVVIFECGKCGARLSAPQDKPPTQDALSECFACKAKWTLGDTGRGQAMTDLVRTLQHIQTLEKEGYVGFRTLLEFEEPAR